MRRQVAAVGLSVAAAFVLVGHVCFRPIWDSDAGWHLAVGRLISAGGIPRTNALAWTARDEPWYATSWLYDWVMAALEARIGVLGMQLFLALLLLLLLVAWAAALLLVDPLGPWLLPAGALLLLPRLTHRPHVATWAAVALVLALCLAGRGREIRYRIGCVLAIALFGNLHAGAAFAAGVAGLFCIEEFVRVRRPAELLVAALCGLAVLANPGAIYNAGYLLAHLRVQSVVELREFLPATFANEPAFFVAAPLALAAGIWNWRRTGVALPAAFAVLALLGLRANRVAYDALIVALPLLAIGLGLVRERLGSRAAALGAVLLAAGSAQLQGYAAWVTPLRLQAGWNEERLAVRAAAFVAREGIDGRRFNALRDGGYLEAALPAQASFADGRIQAYPESFWKAFQDAERGGAKLRDWLGSLGVEWAIATRVRERLGGYRLLDSPDWALVYWDTASEVWLRRDVPRFEPLVARLQYRFFRPYGSIVGAVEHTHRDDLPAFAGEVARFESTSPSDPFAQLVKCALAARAGSPAREAICAVAAAVDEEPLRALAAKAAALAPAP